MLRLSIIFLGIFLIFTACSEEETAPAELQLNEAFSGDEPLELSEPWSVNIQVDRFISLGFSAELDLVSAQNSIILVDDQQNQLNANITLQNDGRSAVIRPVGVLQQNTWYTIEINQGLKSTRGITFAGKTIRFRTLANALQLVSVTFDESIETRAGRIVDVPLNFRAEILFSDKIDVETLPGALRITGTGAVSFTTTYDEDHKKVIIEGNAPLRYLTRYRLEIRNTIKGTSEQSFNGAERIFFTGLDTKPQMPVISDEELLTLVQSQTFKYFWDFAHPNSGMARERNTSGDLVTIGGSGFGVMAILVAIERGFITRNEGVDRLAKIVQFLSSAQRFHGVWPHWLNGNTGNTIPFSQFDDGADLVETSFMIQALLTVRAYLNPAIPLENTIMSTITQLWREVEWDWFRRGGQNVLYWHWSPQHNWQMNLRISGWNECLITYVLAAGSPTHSIDKAVYDEGWARNGNMVNGNNFYGHKLPLGSSFGGPLFFAHYSFLGLDPRNLSDAYAQYMEQNIQHSLINQAHAIENPLGYAGYSEDCWGFTASDGNQGYSAHSPTNDRGVITPTAALSSFPYTPEESMKALKFFYYGMGDRLWGNYGFYDAFNITEQWIASSYLAIDQGPIILMIENHRTGFLWDLFMTVHEVKVGLDRLGFSY
ncbi:MAG: Ig-like domain-containing protein [Cyclobacteriaceae bacterium]|nr:Ig-like domain-containing protein [Cyclobacteriaceae bacterium]